LKDWTEGLSPRSGRRMENSQTRCRRVFGDGPRRAIWSSRYPLTWFAWVVVMMFLLNAESSAPSHVIMIREWWCGLIKMRDSCDFHAHEVKLDVPYALSLAKIPANLMIPL
jgi:hypothetical protein